MALQITYPWPVRLYNKVMKTKPVIADTLIKKVQKQTGLSDFGNVDFITRLERLCDAMNEEAQLHAFGRFAAVQRLEGLLKNRLIAIDYLKCNHHVANVRLNPPIIITGLQRTGTTFLQRIMAADPKHRALLSWEALSPIPNGQSDQQRMRMAKIGQRFLRYISPDFFSIHPVEYNSPEEDVLLNDMTLLSAVPEAIMCVPSYGAWVEKQDHSEAYAWLDSMLRILHNEELKERWVLKTPQHLEYMDLIMQRYPDSPIIMTHRDPKECIVSFCSMMYYSRAVFSDRIDPKEVAQHWIEKNVRMLKNTIAAREKYKDHTVIDVFYKDLVTDPIQTLKSIYGELGCAWGTTVEESFRIALNKNKKDKYGKHMYNAADFGLTDSYIDNSFSFYTQHFF